eukprot:TRINITY_DN1119_c0_g1_i1.p1 TRINITY_DN1119_c0_g1~~TRINITY_DN1119_c0_g1_i1.p1  ORF type:complete len:605 (+),score=157.63 TRINITY_DN1119_c0_g1_i1:217-1815(+)
MVVEKSDVISRLVKRLSDPELSIRIASCGVLRNLTIQGSPKICDQIMSQDCLTSFFLSIKTYDTIRMQPDSEEKDLQETFVENILETLVNLGEFSLRPFQEMIQQGELVQILFTFLKPNITTTEIQTLTVELLCLMTEDSQETKFNAVINAENYLLLKMCLANQKNDLLFRSYVAEILLNTCPHEDTDAILKIAFPTFVQCLQHNSTTLFTEIANSPETMKVLNDKMLLKEVEDKLENWEREVKAQLNTLQLLSNLVLDEESSKMEEDNKEIKVTENVLQHFVNHGICNLILPKCYLMESVISNFYSLKMMKTQLDNFWRLQSRALSCLNNILLSFPQNALGDISGLWKVMFTICAQSFQLPMDNSIISFEAATEIQTILTSILHTLLRKYNSLVLDPNEIQSLFKLITHTNEEIRTNGFEIVGCIAKSPQGKNLIQDIAVILLKGLEDNSVWASTAAADVIFSVFDDYYFDVFMQYNFPQHLKNYSQKLSTGLKQLLASGKKEELLLDRMDEIILNIPQFLQYVEKLNKRK